AQAQPGTEITLKLIRSGKEIEKKVTLGERPTERAAAQEKGDEPRAGSAFGLGIEPLTPELAGRLGLRRDEKGLVVVEITPGSAAASAGLQEGDVIQEIDRQPARASSDLAKAAGTAGGRPLLLLVNRGGSTLFLTLRPR